MRWLNGKRLSLYPRIFAVIYLAVWGCWILTGTGLTDRLGKPIGSDFLVFFTASTLALRGEPAAAYDFKRFYETERSSPEWIILILGLSAAIFWSFFRWTLPYLASLAAWIISTLTLFLVTLRRIAPHPSTIWLALGFPGTFQNLTHGQNGFLIAALLGGGLLSLARFPLVAGILFGLLAIKPHLAALVLVALVAGRHWKTLGTTFLAAGIMVLASGWAFGWSTWTAFLSNFNLPLNILENESSLWGKMITTYGGFRLLGLDSRMASLFQGAVSLTVTGTLWWIWSRKTSFCMKASSLCISALLFTPYAFSYDLAILALPLAWLGWEAHLENWTDLEKLALVMGWLLPLLSSVVGVRTGVPITPLILLWLLYVVFRRSWVTFLPSEGFLPRRGSR
jgi:hypothetical protein